MQTMQLVIFLSIINAPYMRPKIRCDKTKGIILGTKQGLCSKEVGHVKRKAGPDNTNIEKKQLLISWKPHWEQILRSKLNSMIVEVPFRGQN